MPQYVTPQQDLLLSNQFPGGKPGQTNSLYNDLQLPTGSIAWSNQFNDSGTGTTNATIGTTQQITHGLGVVPNFITITETSAGVVYLDTGTAATATTFNVKGTVASLTFNWKVE